VPGERAPSTERGEARSRVRVTFPGSGLATVSSGLPVLDHLLSQLARSAPLDLALEVAPGAPAEEIVGVGRGLGEQLGEPLRAERAVGWGSASVPADEALAHVALEVSGRPLVVSNVDLSAAHLGGSRTDLVGRFLRELAEGAGLTLHVRLLEGEETQHVLDTIFKSLGAALGRAGRQKEG
jgi:imidazoleglycerol-phosphate dehydratase